MKHLINKILCLIHGHVWSLGKNLRPFPWFTYTRECDRCGIFQEYRYNPIASAGYWADTSKDGVEMKWGGKMLVPRVAK